MSTDSFTIKIANPLVKRTLTYNESLSNAIETFNHKPTRAHFISLFNYTVIPMKSILKMETHIEPFELSQNYYIKLIRLTLNSPDATGEDIKEAYQEAREFKKAKLADQLFERYITMILSNVGDHSFEVNWALREAEKRVLIEEEMFYKTQIERLEKVFDIGDTLKVCTIL